jgi:glycosyltransferase involved in cell wall biosynthesis
MACPEGVITIGDCTSNGPREHIHEARMKICSVITSFTTGGAETLVCNLSRRFVRAGHEAGVVALSPASSLGNSPESEERMIARLRSEGIEAACLGLDARRSMLKGRSEIGRFLSTARPDVVHVHTARAALMAGFARTGVPLILTHHNSRLSFPRHLYRLFDRFVFSYVGISAACAAQTARHARRPVRLIVNGAEDRTAIEGPRTGPAAKPTIIAVGTVSDQKDYPTLVATAKRLVPRLDAANMTFDLQIVGGGEGLGRLEGLVRAEGLEDHVRLLGVRNDVPDLLRSADLFVNSSRYEGLSVAMIEALMAALPVVATDVAGNSEVVRPSENGLLVAPADPGALASAIATVLLDRKLYGQFSKGALTSSRAFSLQRCAEEHLGLYAEAIACASNPRQAA